MTARRSAALVPSALGRTAPPPVSFDNDTQMPVAPQLPLDARAYSKGYHFVPDNIHRSTCHTDLSVKPATQPLVSAGLGIQNLV